MWKNGSTWTQLFPANSPAARTLAQVAFDSLLNRVVLFGGNQTLDTFYDDTWVYDGSTWTQINPVTTPENRYAGLGAYNPVTDSILMFSGYGLGGGSPGPIPGCWPHSMSDSGIDTDEPGAPFLARFLREKWDFDRVGQTIRSRP